MADKTLPEQIADRLRRDILRGKLPPGSTVKERDNAAELGVSRTPMREAIRILAREGLVILRPARSPIVADPSLKEVTDDLEVMSALEVLSGELACRAATSDEIAAIRAIHERMAREFDSMEPVDLFEIDMSFHRAIARASHNPSLEETHAGYLARLWRARYLSASRRRSRDRVLRQHGAIVEGLEARDVEQVAGTIQSHLYHLVANISDVFQKREAEDAAAQDTMQQEARDTG
ncbi:GntR family transcriptional regulator [Tranquillimonas alkanivorans]|uniref:Transcriptional regulator, GntR family n=1 Tax=Tranquillimonas alkanivorans TaxID=441119 RepID=A0A1I5QC65_9RHOB|nr:GntR family transcriptional regulator [Tranquillimonas alkanivorans]SFP43862.1 transcriptional regulator, GntR family [Tranquillimonas alkanivorans]